MKNKQHIHSNIPVSPNAFIGSHTTPHRTPHKYMLVYLAFALWKVQLRTVQTVLLKPWSFWGLWPLDPTRALPLDPTWDLDDPHVPAFKVPTLHLLNPPSCQRGYGPVIFTTELEITCDERCKAIYFYSVNRAI